MHVGFTTDARSKPLLYGVLMSSSRIPVKPHGREGVTPRGEMKHVILGYNGQSYSLIVIQTIILFYTNNSYLA